MTDPVLIDTGPLVAYLREAERAHDWCRQQWQSICGAVLTCEAVVTEACFLLTRTGGDAEGVLELLRRGVVRIEFSLVSELEEVSGLMQKYADVPMSLADACLVRMAELHPGSAVLTLDSDFHVYRKNRRRRIPTIMPG